MFSRKPNQHLLLREEIYSKVITGEKKSTSRQGIRNIKKGPLRLIMTECEDIYTDVKVVNVTMKPFSEINLEDAKKEGYDSIEELQKVLRQIYPNLSENNMFTFITWK